MWNCVLPVSIPPKPIQWQPTTKWIMPSTPRHRFYLRRTVELADYAQSGWLRMSANNDFVLYVNGRAIAEEYSYFGRIPRNSIGLGRNSSELTQTFSDSGPYDLRTGDVIQVSCSRDWKLTGYFDLTRYLQPGKNVIAVELQASHLHPQLLAEGAIYPVLDPTSAIRLDTGSTDWKLSPLPVNYQKIKWFDVAMSDANWQQPKQLPAKEKTYSRLTPPLFDRLLQGQWITGHLGPHGEVFLQQQWTLPNAFERAVVRFAGEGHYSVSINGKLVHQTLMANSDQLNLYEVTRLLHPGVNTISAKLLQPLSPEWQSAHSAPLSFLLDGWAEDNQAQVSHAIATDETWRSQAVTSTLVGDPANQPSNQIEATFGVSVVGPPIPHSLERVYQGDASQFYIGEYLLAQFGWMSGGIALSFAIAQGLGRFVQRKKNISSPAILLGTAVLTPSLLFLIIVGLLKHRYAEAERGIFFVQANVDWLILLIAICGVSLSLLWTCRPKSMTAWQKGGLLFLASWLACTGLSIIVSSYLPILLVALSSVVVFLSQAWHRWRQAQLAVPDQPRWCQWIYHIHDYHWIAGAILLLGFGLRAYSIGFNDLEPDENVSYDAVRGILRTGVPISTSKIWYTRGPFFHYPLALWLKIVGLSPEHARMWSVLWAVGTLVMVFVLARLVSGKVSVAAIAMLIVAIDPWELWYSRNVRFYQQTQFLYLLSCWSFYRGFVDASVLIQEPKRWYQYICFISLACLLLTQEVTMTLMPSFILGALYFYRDFKWLSDWRVIISGFMSSVMFVFNALVFSITCLTPLVGLSSMTTGQLKFQVGNITFFGTDFFVGFNRMHTLYSLMFFGGWLYFCRQKDGRKLFLFNMVLLSIMFVTVLVSLKASRYTYPCYPLFILLAAYSAFTIAERFGTILSTWIGPLLPMKTIAIAAVAILYLGNIEPDRILASYSESLTPRHLEVSQYIVDHKRPGDVVISNTPSVHANVLKGADYYVPHRMSFFDAAYMHNGRLIDRWEGRLVLTTTDQLSDVLTHADRVWIHVFHQAQLPRDAELAKFYDVLQTISQPVLDTYGASLRLWTKEDGIFQLPPNRGRDFGAY